MDKQNFDDAINIVYEVSDQLWNIYSQYKMGDWCSKNEVKYITKNYAIQLDTALKILEKERK